MWRVAYHELRATDKITPLKNFLIFMKSSNFSLRLIFRKAKKGQKHGNDFKNKRFMQKF